MIIYLTIDSQHLLLVGREEGLSAALRVDDGQALMAQDGRGAGIDTTPVGTAVTDLLTHAERFLTQLWRLLLDIEYSYNSTHNLYLLNSTLVNYLLVVDAKLQYILITNKQNDKYFRKKMT